VNTLKQFVEIQSAPRWYNDFTVQNEIGYPCASTSVFGLCPAWWGGMTLTHKRKYLSFLMGLGPVLEAIIEGKYAGQPNHLELRRRALLSQLQTADVNLRAEQKPADEFATSIHV
jgi:hypothetical protein